MLNKKAAGVNVKKTFNNNRLGIGKGPELPPALFS
jgi:hypothetical protein